MRRWVREPHMDGVRDTQGIYPRITTIEVLLYKRARTSAISVHPPGFGAGWPIDAYLTRMARERPLRCHPWKIARGCR